MRICFGPTRLVDGILTVLAAHVLFAGFSQHNTREAALRW